MMWESTTCLSCSGAHFPCQPCRPVDMIHVSPVPVWTRTLGEHTFVRQDSKGKTIGQVDWRKSLL